MFHIKFRAGALQYTIFIAVVIALLIFAFISLSYTQRSFKERSNHYLETIRNTDLAINYIAKSQIDYEKPVQLSFSTHLNDKTAVEKKNWGIFDLAIASSTIKFETFVKKALIGGFLEDRPNLYLKDNNQPLVVVGDARIEGSVYLPKQAVKRGTIAGNAYTGSELIYGTVNYSNNRIPLLENREMLERICNRRLQFSNMKPLELQDDIILTNSFGEPIQFFSTEMSLDLKGIKLIGNIIVHSGAKIRIYPSANLTDVILIAPEIEILNNVEGTFQAFATDKIVMGKNCRLKYPSALVVYEKNKRSDSVNMANNEQIEQIEIHSDSEVRGIVCFLSNNEQNNYKAQVFIDKNASVLGEVYCDKNVELKGDVIGSIFTNGFIANEYGSVYQNHIYNGRILSSNFPLEYCGMRIENSTNSIVKWVY